MVEATSLPNNKSPESEILGIKHVITNKKGVFFTKRNYESLLETINIIKKDYQKIQEEMKDNNLPTNKEFIKEIGNSSGCN